MNCIGMMQNHNKFRITFMKPSRDAFVMSPDSKKIPRMTYFEYNYDQEKLEGIKVNNIFYDYNKLNLASCSNDEALPNKNLSKFPSSVNKIHTFADDVERKNQHQKTFDMGMPNLRRNEFINPKELEKTNDAEETLENQCEQKLNETFEFEISNGVNHFDTNNHLMSAACLSTAEKTPINIRPCPNLNDAFIIFNTSQKQDKANVTYPFLEKSCDGIMDDTFANDVNDLFKHFKKNYTCFPKTAAFSNTEFGYRITCMDDQFEKKKETTKSEFVRGSQTQNVRTETNCNGKCNPQVKAERLCQNNVAKKSLEIKHSDLNSKKQDDILTWKLNRFFQSQGL